ncbi:hypothetical protein VA7868_04353 [Vibrio aerogenes CECT 7868]|uniref:Uncharacterized protein n=1 Tax=Vibrio aerogenes CECT 7868 TaxID=1216006 RepID=A0A1M6DY57_9VIBR|nr:hypothetical protein VA7868_04353 [Vibrio aerogenes CECT 7868]
MRIVSLESLFNAMNYNLITDDEICLLLMRKLSNL